MKRKRAFAEASSSGTWRDSRLEAVGRPEARCGGRTGSVILALLIVAGLLARATVAPGGLKAHQATLGLAGILLALCGIAWTAACDGVGVFRETRFRTEQRLDASRSTILALQFFLAFLGVTLAIRLPAVQSLDAAFLRQAYEWGGAMPVMRLLSNAGGGKLLTHGIPLVCLALWAAGRARSLRFFLVAMFGTFGIEGFFKTLVHRARPDLVHGSFFNSFPSGHALAAAILAGALLMIGLPGCARPGSRYLIWSAAIAWTVLVSGARVCLGTHYPTDILGGVLLGATWVFTCRAMLLGLASPATAEQGTTVDQHALPARVPIEEPARPLRETV